MSDLERKFHETWLGMVQPIEGLVVSVPVLVDAQCIERQPPEVQQTLLRLCPARMVNGEAADGGRVIRDLGELFAELLGLTPDLFDVGDALPEKLGLYVPEGRQLLRPTMALRKLGGPTGAYEALVWDVAASQSLGATGDGVGAPSPGHPAGSNALDLDKPETVTGPWDYPAAAKFDRLLRHCKVPIGILTNREVVRLVYAPHGESSGHITFRVGDMATVGGRPILDAFVMLLSASRFFGVAEERALPALLAESRKRQANVTNELAEQVFDALQVLLRGFEAAAERDGRDILDDALAREGDHLYKGLLTVLLRLVFLLYAEDRGLLPTEERVYAEHLSVLGLFQELQEDAGAHPDSMSRRFGAWGRLLALFRAVYLGVEHGELRMPARRGTLFDPHRFPFLEGWGPAGSAPIVMAEDRAAVHVPTVDDETIFLVLEKLVLFEGQRLSYRTLDVEQIGSVYEALMGFHVLRLPAAAVCMRPNGVWLTVAEVLEVPAGRRAAWLKDTVGLSKAQAEKLAGEVNAAKGPGRSEQQDPRGVGAPRGARGSAEAVLEALSEYGRAKRKADRALSQAKAGQLVLQPGSERRRTSSHYTPRSLSAPIVRRTLEPLLACMGPEPPSERLLELKICDPAMGSGAFLVEACRFLGDALLAAWTREGALHTAPGFGAPTPLPASSAFGAATAGALDDPVLHARRMVAQRCLYGVDKNESAVELAKLSLWLVTLAKDLPFTFLDHALRHGDSLVGLSFDQIRAFHWKPESQVHLAEQVLKDALDEAIAIRQQILALAGDPSPEAQREKQRLLLDSEDACDRARLIGDVVVGAFFACEKDKDREKARLRRLELVERWIAGDAEAEGELRAAQAEVRARLPVFHWMLEFPEVFYAERPDPLDDARVNRAAFMDAFVGNPPFMGVAFITERLGEGYLLWLQATFAGTSGKFDLCAHFFRRAAALLGAHGTIGFIATNTIAQGDTRATGLAHLVLDGVAIYDAASRMPWAGGPNIAVSVVHLARGNVEERVRRRLDGRSVTEINSRLRAAPERQDPVRLAANSGCCFQGSIVLGMGFTLTPEERDSLIARGAQNALRIFAYMGGEDANSSPIQGHSRYVIDFGDMPLEQAGSWPDLLEIVREKAKPERDRSNRAAYRNFWWRFAEPQTRMREAISDLARCLVGSQVTKHLVLAWQPTDRIFAHTLNVFPLQAGTAFAVLQSRSHETWARFLSSTLEDRAATSRLRYTGSDCFDTFPFPQPDPRTVIPSLEDIGERLYSTRAAYMIETQQGLTQTYNKLKDPSCHDAPIALLRRLHEEMDRAVLDAYGWKDIEVPPFCPATEAEQEALEAFNDEVIDRLFVLNAERAEEERLAGLGGGKKAKQKGQAGRKKGDAKTGGDDDDGRQGTLGLG